MRDRKAGRPVFIPIRYADDFIILVSGTYKDALREKEELASYLKDIAKLDLSQEKTRITPTDKGFEFLGHRIRMKWDDRYGYSPRIEIPKRKVSEVCYRIKWWTTRSTTLLSLAQVLRKINPIVRGWGYFYRYCTGAKRILTRIDWYTWERLWRWMRKKHPEASAPDIMCFLRRSAIRPRRKVWREGTEEQCFIGYLKVQRFKRGWMRRPDYALISGEPSA
jgi:hypothetical protein